MPQFEAIEWDGVGLFHLDNQYPLKGFGYSEVKPATKEEYEQFVNATNQKQ